MRVIPDAWSSSDLPRCAVATIGNFDGVHRGQRAIIERVVTRARRCGCPAVVVTFEPHPLAVLRPGEEPPRLATPAQKRSQLAGIGVDVLLVIDFTVEFSRVEAEHFVRDFLGRRLAAREIYVGSRFAFGRDRKGDLALLQRLGSVLDFGAAGVEEVLWEGQPISSTRIREAIRQGRVEEAGQMLGRPYTIGGRVVRGEGRGKGLGWPTVNLTPDNELLPADGVYTSEVRFDDDGDALPSVTNIGRRPTFHTAHPRVVESHILDFHDDVYGERLELAFRARLRGEVTFAGAEELRRQISRDVESAREYFRTAER